MSENTATEAHSHQMTVTGSVAPLNDDAVQKPIEVVHGGPKPFLLFQISPDGEDGDINVDVKVTGLRPEAISTFLRDMADGLEMAEDTPSGD